MSYYRPSKAVEVTQVVKKSQFIGNSAIVTNSAEAIAFVQQIKMIHSGANHSCHCFVAGLPEQSSYWGYSDDGEATFLTGANQNNMDPPAWEATKHLRINTSADFDITGFLAATTIKHKRLYLFYLGAHNSRNYGH